MKVTLENLNDIGKGIQEEYNNLIEIFSQNLVERKLRVGTTEILTNSPIESLESFKEIVDRMSNIGCSVGILKSEQVLNKGRITIIEEQIGCYKCLLKNLKTLRFNLYAKREDISKNIHIVGSLRFDKEQAEQYLTTYIHALYTRIARLRNELWNMREGEVIDFDESVFEKDDLLIEEDKTVIQALSKSEHEKATLEQNPNN